MKQVRSGGGRRNGTQTNMPKHDVRSKTRANAEWHAMSEDLQTALAQQAMHRAAMIVAEQAEMFAKQFRAGTLQDRGAEDALRLFAAILRETSTASLTPAGHA